MSGLPDAKIVQTTVTPNGRGLDVRLQISDGSLADLSAPSSAETIHVQLSVQVESGVRPLSAIEWDALDFADSVIKALMRDKADEMKAAKYHHPRAS